MSSCWAAKTPSDIHRLRCLDRLHRRFRWFGHPVPEGLDRDRADRDLDPGRDRDPIDDHARDRSSIAVNAAAAMVED